MKELKFKIKVNLYRLNQKKTVNNFIILINFNFETAFLLFYILFLFSIIIFT